MLSVNPDLGKDEQLSLPDEEKPDEADCTLLSDDNLQPDDTPFYANQLEDPEIYFQYQAYLDECYEN